MKPVHDWAGAEPGDQVGRERPPTRDPDPPDDEHTRPDVGTSADTDRIPEEAGYGYGV
jgi:hypothetical protein